MTGISELEAPQEGTISQAGTGYICKPFLSSVLKNSRPRPFLSSPTQIRINSTSSSRSHSQMSFLQPNPYQKVVCDLTVKAGHFHQATSPLGLRTSDGKRVPVWLDKQTQRFSYRTLNCFHSNIDYRLSEEKDSSTSGNFRHRTGHFFSSLPTKWALKGKQALRRQLFHMQNRLSAVFCFNLLKLHLQINTSLNA